MKALISPCSPPLLVTRARSSCNLFSPSSAKKAWRLHSQAKGFGRVATTERKDEITKNKNKGNHNDDEDDKIAPEIWDRMIVRILFYVGAPMATGVALLYVFGALKDQKIWDVPLWLPFLTTLVTFGTSTLGIAYGTLSTNLDPEKKGSLLGWEEVQQNWPELWKEENESRRS